jgi:glutamate transport system substrate-binding protein
VSPVRKTSLRFRLAAAVALAVALPLSVTACGGGDSGGSAASGKKEKIVIGTKFDQPGLGLKGPDGKMSGFDVDVATYVAQQLGYAPEKIEWKESVSAQRENLIDNDQVDYIVATYSINDERKKRVDFAGPYLVTGQSLLVKADNTDITGKVSLANNKKLCSVKGSTPAQKIKDEFPSVQLQEYPNYSACIEALKNGAVDAVTTDEVILAGFAAQTPGTFKVVGDTFSTEKYGVGLKKGDAELQTKVNDAITKMEGDGAWKAAFDKNLGPAGIKTPQAPAIEK